MNYVDIPSYKLADELGADASKWADAFTQIFPEYKKDEDTLLGWFANAIEKAREIEANMYLPAYKGKNDE